MSQRRRETQMLLLTIEPREQGVSQREFGVPPLDQPRREFGVPLDQPRREFGVPPTALVPRDAWSSDLRSTRSSSEPRSALPLSIARMRLSDLSPTPLSDPSSKPKLSSRTCNAVEGDGR